MPQKPSIMQRTGDTNNWPDSRGRGGRLELFVITTLGSHCGLIEPWNLSEVFAVPKPHFPNLKITRPFPNYRRGKITSCLVQTRVFTFWIYILWTFGSIIDVEIVLEFLVHHSPSASSPSSSTPYRLCRSYKYSFNAAPWISLYFVCSGVKSTPHLRM